jgi:Leucine-rich repeat (LRR) protein
MASPEKLELKECILVVEPTMTLYLFESTMETFRSSLTGFSVVFRLLIDEKPIDGLTRIQTGAFADAGSLQWIRVLRNPLRTIEANAFVGASNMRTIDFRFNQIERISVFAFNGLTNLRDLMMENNRIAHIQANLFKPLTNVQLIYLSYNDIESIEGRTFANNRQLRHVDFTQNPVQEIQRTILDDLKNLEAFIIPENDCVSDAWIVAPVDEIREGLSKCFDNFDGVQ